MPAAARRNQTDRVAESASRLTAAFADLLVERGYERTTAADIGERAGYSRAMVRERFGSKQELLSHLQKNFEQRLFADARLDDAPTPSGLQRALMAFDALERFAHDEPQLLRALFVVGMEAVTTEHVFREVWTTTLALVRDSFAEWLQQGRDDGSVEAELDVDISVDDIVTSALGASYLWARDGDLEEYTRRIRHHRTAFEHRWTVTD